MALLDRSGDSSNSSQTRHFEPLDSTTVSRVRILKAPGLTDEERAQLIADLLVLKKPQIQEFLEQRGVPKSGTKAEIRERIEEAIARGELAPSSIVQFLDEVTPWGKQHVYLYDGPANSIAEWRDRDWVQSHLKRHRLGKYLNASLPLALPEKMKLSSILHTVGRVRITAVKKRVWPERQPALDESKWGDGGESVELRAFVHRVTRSVVTFEWDLRANTAFLQISQLPGSVRYEDVAAEFFAMIKDWLDGSRFSIVDLRPRIQRLHEIEERGGGETRSHSINYRTLEGRRLEGTSASPGDPLLGEPLIDAALAAVRRSGVGHLGNFYWLPTGASDSIACPLESEVHVIIVGFHNRVSFPTPNGEQVIRYVLSRIRNHCQ